MNNPKVGDVVQIHSYKHNGKIHRAWKEAIIVDCSESHIIAANNHTLVIESDGRNWITREPAICYFFKNHWFNVIGMLRKDGIYYYCNICSPFLFEEGAIKYVDYDLDVKVFPNSSYRILDRDEYERHKQKMHYPAELESIVEKELKILLEMIRNNEGAFAKGAVEQWYSVFKDDSKGE